MFLVYYPENKLLCVFENRPPFYRKPTAERVSSSAIQQYTCHQTSFACVQILYRTITELENTSLRDPFPSAMALLCSLLCNYMYT